MRQRPAAASAFQEPAAPVPAPAASRAPATVGARRSGTRRVRSIPLAAELADAATAGGPRATLTAAFITLLHRCSGQAEIEIACRQANRRRPGGGGAVVSTRFAHCDVTGDPGFGELVGRVARALPAPPPSHQAVPAAVMTAARREAVTTAEGAPPRAPSAFSVVDLECEWPGVEAEAALGAWDLAPRFDLEVVCLLGQSPVVEMLWIGDAALYPGASLARLAGHFGNLLAAGGARPECPISRLPLLGEAERSQLVVQWNDVPAPTAAGGGPRLLPAAFVEAARRQPRAEALVDGRRRWTYGELAERAAAIAGELRRRGVGPETRVGVCLERSAEMVAALLAVLLAGGAYLPLDPAYPADRLRYLVEDSGARLVVASVETAAALDGTSSELLLVSAPPRGDARRSAGTPASIASLDLAGVMPDNLAYVIYTSGSTGRPKGVPITHRCAAALVDWARAVYSPAELSGALAATSICFDLSVFELFVPLSAGGRVILAAHVLDLPRLPAAAEVTLINTVPTLAAELAGAGAIPPGVTTINLAGEPLPRLLAERLYGLAGVERVYNLYGPSEDTTYSTWELVARGAKPAIGRPIAGTRTLVLDGKLRPVPVGQTGELFLGGAGQARGYLGRPALTAERFIPDPFPAAPGDRLYRTGDLVQWLPDGRLDYLGRGDAQVKLRGCRIEPGEIEAVLAEHPAVREAAVVLRTTESGEPLLVAYAALTDAGPPPPGAGAAAAPSAAQRPGEAELRDHLAARLPLHMVPSVVLVLPRLPRGANGKLERAALPPPPAPGEQRRAAAPAAPLTSSEELLVEIWRDILGVDAVAIGDSFFALGGHSLAAMRHMTRLRELLGLDLPVRALDQAPSLGAFASLLESRLLAELDEAGENGSGRQARGSGVAGSALPARAEMPP
jgi:myxalamid-type nonribosomal peptide synthetase MxaA